MIWSGLTKYMLAVVLKQVKAIEIPGFIVIGPLIERWEKYPIEKERRNSSVK